MELPGCNDMKVVFVLGVKDTLVSRGNINISLFNAYIWEDSMALISTVFSYIKVVYMLWKGIEWVFSIQSSNNSSQ